MKTIILISSIFYIIGLTIGNKIDLSPKTNPAEKIITNKISTKKTDDSYKIDLKTDIQTKTDSLTQVKSKEIVSDKSK